MDAAEQTDGETGGVGIDLMLQRNDASLKSFGRRGMPTSAPDHIPHACQNTSQIRETADNARHRIVGMDLILQIH